MQRNRFKLQSLYAKERLSFRDNRKSR